MSRPISPIEDIQPSRRPPSVASQSTVPESSPSSYTHSYIRNPNAISSTTSLHREQQGRRNLGSTIPEITQELPEDETDDVSGVGGWASSSDDLGGNLVARKQSRASMGAGSGRVLGRPRSGSLRDQSIIGQSSLDGVAGSTPNQKRTFVRRQSAQHSAPGSRTTWAGFFQPSQSTPLLSNWSSSLYGATGNDPAATSTSPQNAGTWDPWISRASPSAGDDLATAALRRRRWAQQNPYRNSAPTFRAGFSDERGGRGGRREGGRPSRRFHRRSGFYDDGNTAPNLEKESIGMRVWYDDYTTIDWIHDFIKEKIRLRSLRNIGGIKGWFMVNYDAAQAWIVVFLIGVICGVIAAGLQIGQDYLTDLKEGYCKYNFLHRKRLCCPEPGRASARFTWFRFIWTIFSAVFSMFRRAQTPMAPSFRSGTSPLPECDGWVTWAEHLGLAQNDTIAIPLPWLPEGETQTFDTNFTINYIAYIGFGALFAFTAALLVYVSPTVYSMDDRAPDNLRDQPSFASLRTAFLLSRPNTTSSTSAVPAAATRKPRRIIYHAAGSGIPEVKTMLGGFVIRGFLGLRTLVVKVIGLTLSVSSGLSIGVQGPLVHIGACVGNVIARMFAKFAKNEGKRREILSAACATGVSVAFGAPIGGVLFSLEDVSYYFPPKTMWRSFFCALMGAVTLKLINPLGSGKLVLFQVSYDRDWQFFELVPFMALGIFGGIYGALFIHVYMAYLKFKSSISKYINQVVDVVIVTIAVGAVSYLNPFTRVSSPQLVAALFSECPRQEVRTLGSTAGWESVIGTLCSGERDMEVMKLLAICLGLKVLLNVVSFPLKVPAGIFVPSMAVGAIAGRMLGMGVLLLRDAFPEHPVFSSCPVEGDCVIPGVYAMVGAAAALTGVTRMTVSLVVIMFELTGALSYTLPIMLAIMISKWLADFLCRASIYEKMIGLNGHPYLDQKREYVHSKTVVEVMEPVVVVPASGNSPSSGVGPSNQNAHGETALDVKRPYNVRELEAMLHRLSRGRWSDDGGFPILDDGGILVGYIAWNELRHAIEGTKAQGTDDRYCYFRRSMPSIRPLNSSPRLLPTTASAPTDLRSQPSTSQLDLSPTKNSPTGSMQWSSHSQLESNAGGASGSLPKESFGQPLGLGASSSSQNWRSSATEDDLFYGTSTSTPQAHHPSGYPSASVLSSAPPSSGMTPQQYMQQVNSPSSEIFNEYHYTPSAPPPPPHPAAPPPSQQPPSATILVVPSTPAPVFSLAVTPWEQDPNDFTQWMDQAPLTVYENTSMEMVTEIFVKLGTKTILVVSHDGRCVGVIHKKRLLAYLNHGV